MLNIQLTAATLFMGGGGLYNSIATGFKSLGYGTVGDLLDAGLQFGGGMLAGSSASEAFGDINFVQSSLSGLGVNPFRSAITASVFQFSTSGGFESTLNGKISASQFVQQAGLGVGTSLFYGSKLTAPALGVGESYLGTKLK